ncbi:MAG TPA: family 16 glycoside hydrolase, partial [Planctomycetaceae bacterium]|nr:family 16 glycoside hydrolase [Planctomycetaceae bacterium]
MISQRSCFSFVLAGLAALGLWSCSAAFGADDDGWQTIFDGKTLDGWDGNPDFWRVEDGAITGQTTAEKPTKGNTFIIWRKGETADFELKVEYKIVPMNDKGFGNSGIQYRSFEVPNEKWVIGGYQADFEAGDTYSGINYGERFRGILAGRGEKTVIGPDHKPKVLEKIGDSAEIQKKIKKEDWNEYHVTAEGFTFTHKINGVTTSICTDEDTEQRRAKGVLALQLHAGLPMKVQFRNIKIKPLKSEGSAATSSAGTKQILLLAGGPSHLFGAHDHLAGCSLLAKLLNQSGLPVEARVHSLQKSGWPKPEELAAAKTIVIYADGGGGHPFNSHLEELSNLTAKGTGVVCIHYGVEVPKGPSGEKFLDWTGGYFEPHWSVNPHWTAYYRQLPKHPTTNGVKPFSTKDEWYYHMRFREDMKGVTPILTDLPPKESASGGDGSHSGNPAVRKAVLEDKEPQHMAWATQRPDGGRGF